MNCPRESKEMIIRKTRKRITFRGKRLAISFDQYVCPKCGLEAGTIEQTAAIQKSILDAYRKSTV